MNNDTRVGIGPYWANCSPLRRREIATAAGLSIEYIAQIASGKKRASRWASIALVSATAGVVRPYSLRPDLWSYGAEIPSGYVSGLEQLDQALEQQIADALRAWVDASTAPKERQRELAAELAHLVRQRDDGVVAWLEKQRAHIGLATRSADYGNSQQT